MTKTIEFIFDFVSPNAYLTWWPLKDLAQRTRAEIKVTPAYLSGIMSLTNNRPPLMRDAEVKGKNAYMMLEFRRFIHKHGLSKFVMNPGFPFQTLMLQRMLIACEDEAARHALIDMLLPPLWEEQLDPMDPEALRAVFDKAGFDPKPLMAKAQAKDVKDALKANTAQAVERGAFGIPTFFIGEEMFFGKERLGQMEELLTAG
ncbi:MAG: 2-hydroxychromene-2-carboxylate isomerase [Pseudomonadota bacterium]